MSDSTVLYLAGPMRGYAYYNFPRFDQYAEILREKGYTVISPADMDREAGFDPATATQEEVDSHFLPGMIERDLVAIIHKADAVALLPGWEESRGAKLEAHTALFLGKPVYTVLLDGFLPHFYITPIELSVTVTEASDA